MMKRFYILLSLLAIFFSIASQIKAQISNELLCKTIYETCKEKQYSQLYCDNKLKKCLENDVLQTYPTPDDKTIATIPDCDRFFPTGPNWRDCVKRARLGQPLLPTPPPQPLQLTQQQLCDQKEAEFRKRLLEDPLCKGLQKPQGLRTIKINFICNETSANAQASASCYPDPTLPKFIKPSGRLVGKVDIFLNNIDSDFCAILQHEVQHVYQCVLDRLGNKPGHGSKNQCELDLSQIEAERGAYSKCYASKNERCFGESKQRLRRFCRDFVADFCPSSYSRLTGNKNYYNQYKEHCSPDILNKELPALPQQRIYLQNWFY